MKTRAELRCREVLKKLIHSHAPPAEKYCMAVKALKRIWWVYLARCADASLYCGITTDLERRFSEHNSSPKGARYTRSRRPIVLAWSQKQKTRSAALKREFALKQFTRRQKEMLVQTNRSIVSPKKRPHHKSITII